MEKQNEVKKVLIVTAFPTYGAGSGVLVTTQAKQYKKNGLETRIITGNNTTNFEKIPGIQYHVVPFTSEKENSEKIEGQCDFNYLMFTTHTESTANFWDASLEQIEQYQKVFRKAISQEVKEFKPDVIHAQHNWISSSIASEFHVPVVVTIHGTDLMGFERSKEEIKNIQSKMKQKLEPEEKKRLEAELRKYNLYIEQANCSAINAKKIIVISEAQKEKFAQLFPLAASKVELVKNGYDPEKNYRKEVGREELKKLTSTYASNHKVPTDYDKMVLFVGKFAEFKGIDVLLDAAKKYETKMGEKGKKVLTVIVGSGQLEEKLQNQAKDLQLENTHFVGRKTIDEINLLQNLADVSLVPSRNEPFGLVVIEGAACGHPVIGTNAGGIPDILNITGKKIKQIYLPEDVNNPDILKPDEGTKGTYTTPLGMLVPMEDSQELADAVIKILDGEKKFDSNFIADYIKQNYSQDNITKDILRIFNEVSQKSIGVER